MRLSRAWLCLLGVALLLTAASTATAAECVGQVLFAGTPVPGATVVVSQGDREERTLTDENGRYRFPDLPEGQWTLRVAMLGFGPAQVDVSVTAAASPTTIALTLRTFEETVRDGEAPQEGRSASAPLPVTPASSADATTSSPSTGAAAEREAPDGGAVNATAADAADGLLVNGSVNNGAASPFAQLAAFGNNRTGRRSLYNWALGGVLGASALDSRPFSFSGQPTPKPDYRDVQAIGTFGGPIPIPGFNGNKPTLFVGYQKNVDHAASTQSGLVPSSLERLGDFSQSRDAFGRPVSPIDPTTGVPFPNSVIPSARLSPQALALLAYYPHPNVDGAGGYNYQAPVLTTTNQDNLQLRVSEVVNTRNTLTGTLAFRRARTDATSLFGFTDAATTGNLDAAAVWSRRFSPFFSSRLRYQFARATSDVTPYFAGNRNVSGLAGIAGNAQDPSNWGPPSLGFSDGLSGLTDAQFATTTANTHGMVAEGLWSRGRHYMTIGGGLHRTGVHALGGENGRGTFTFTGAASGAPLADFLLGLPHASAIAFGGGDIRLHGRSYELYFTDDWRVSPGLTINAGVRWEYEAPMEEARGRLSNLDLTPGFTSAAIVTPDAPAGPLTGSPFPQALLHPDRRGIQPRIGVAWRPIAGSSLVVRAGYGIYRNTSTYQPIALLMARQPPYATALSIETSPTAPLTLANGFPTNTSGAPTTFAVDPDFRVGESHTWQALVQRDLPASLTVSAAYLGTRGRHLLQEFLPNTYPAGAQNPCPACPSGFAYLTSGGSSSRHAGQFQLRRRLRNGLTASAQYTVSKALDNAGAFSGAALSGAAIAQDWTNLDAEQGPSPFDQRHLLTMEVQYSTGVGVAGGGLLTGLKGALLKGWTFSSQMTAGSGLPLTPTYLASVAGTGVTGSLRAALTGAPTDAPSGLYLNPAAYAVPQPGTWGDAGRNSIAGPAQFNLSAGVARSFPWGDRMTLDWRLDATNVLNRVTWSAVDTIVGSPRFGAPTRANPMRKIQTSLRLRF